MTIHRPLDASRAPRPRAIAALCTLLAAACAPGAQAEHADRTRQIEVTSSQAAADNLHQTAEFSGDVVVSQGTLQIHADRVQMRPGANGERLGFAYGTAGAPVRFRQHGDKPDEWSEGQADRVEYDSTANEVRLIGAASLRNLNGTVVTQQVTSDVITYDTARDTVAATHAASRTAQEADGRPASRAKMVFAPRSTPSADPPNAGSAPTLP